MFYFIVHDHVISHISLTNDCNHVGADMPVSKSLREIKIPVSASTPLKHFLPNPSSSKFPPNSLSRWNLPPTTTKLWNKDYSPQTPKPTEMPLGGRPCQFNSTTLTKSIPSMNVPAE